MKDLQQKILDHIGSYDRIIIHRHQRPDPDAIGSQLGLKALIQATYPDKTVLAAGSSAGSLTYLGQMDKVADQDYQQALVIVTDTANAGRIDDDRYPTGHFIIKIDHHPENEDGHYADLSWEDPTFSSCSEMVALLWKENKDSLKMTPSAARLLYAGMVGDTHRFLYPSTSRQTMHLAGDLMAFDFDHTALNDQMNRLTVKEAQLQAYLYNHLVILDSAMAYLIINHDLMDELGITDSHTHSLVPLPRSIQGVLLWGIFVQQADQSYRCRLRSAGPTINQIAIKHGGGGHALASGANASDLDEVHQIIEEMSQLGLDYKQ